MYKEENQKGSKVSLEPFQTVWLYYAAQKCSPYKPKLEYLLNFKHKIITSTLNIVIGTYHILIYYYTTLSTPSKY
jgi:hypothetical protein